MMLPKNVGRMDLEAISWDQGTTPHEKEERLRLICGGSFAGVKFADLYQIVRKLRHPWARLVQDQMEMETARNVGLLTIEEDGCASGQFHIIRSPTHVPLLLVEYHTTYITFITLWEHCRDFEDLAHITTSFEQFKQEARDEGKALLNFNEMLPHETTPFFEVQILNHATEEVILFKGINRSRPLLQRAKKFFTFQPACMSGLN